MAWVPYDCETSVIKKYWGAVYRLLDDRRENQAMQGEYGKPKKVSVLMVVVSSIPELGLI